MPERYLAGPDFKSGEYTKLLQIVGRFSRLFSESNTPYFHSRFIERLFVHCSNGVDMSRRDMSFDALLMAREGVGVKTFISNSASHKFEKVAEFNRLARSGAFSGLKPKDLAVAVARARNRRIESDVQEYRVNLSGSFYHCLIRFPDSTAIIHEEPYRLINDQSIVVDSSGSRSSRSNQDCRFSDGLSEYTFNVSKSVLFKRFAFEGSLGHRIQLVADPEIFLKLSNGIFDDVLGLSLDKVGHRVSRRRCVLPLYGYKSGSPFVFPRSGINQWNAGGRRRAFGECYIPIPEEVHRKTPNFFPRRDEPFQLRLPDGTNTPAKVCQDGPTYDRTLGKALMSSPNWVLCDWLFRLIDLEAGAMERRFSERRPYTYSDLIRIGKDCVVVTRLDSAVGDFDYELNMAPIGTYEDFLSQE